MPFTSSPNAFNVAAGIGQERRTSPLTGGAYGIGSALQGTGVDAYRTGLEGLYAMLARGGRTDPTLMNMQLADISRGTQGQQDAIAGGLAMQGIQNSGLGMALQAATGQGGRALRSRAIAEDRAMADQRQMQNLQTLYDLVIGPGIDLFGIQQGMDAQNRARRDQRNAAIMGAVSSLGSSYLQSRGNK